MGIQLGQESRRGNDIESRSRALNAVQCYRKEMRSTTLRCCQCRGRRGCRLFLLLSLTLLFAAPQSAAGQENRTVSGCSRCPEGQYNDISRGCQPCTKCLGGLVERLPCANGDPYYCDIYGQFDRLCCEAYEYEAYGICVLNCTKCEVTGRCNAGLPECDCPPERYGNLCQFIITSPPTTPPAVMPEITPETQAERSNSLETWHFALIALGIVVSVVGFAATILFCCRMDNTTMSN